MNGPDNNGPALRQRFQELWDKLVEPAKAASTEERRLSRLLSAVLLTTSFLGVSIEIEYYVRWGSFNIADMVAFSGISTILVAYFINRSGYFRPAAILSVASTTVTTFLTILIAESFHDNSTLLFYLIIPILMTEFFLGTGEYIVVSSLILASVLVLHFFKLNVIDIFILLFCMTVLLGISSFSRRRLEHERQSALREAEKRYRTLVEEIPAITYIDRVDAPGQTIYVSPQIGTLLGIEQDDWLAGGFELWVRHLHPDDREQTLAQYASAQKNGQPLDMEYRLVHEDGRVLWVRDRATVEKDENAKPVFFHGLISDITEKKLSEIARKKSDERYHLLFESMLDGFALHEIICDDDGLPHDYRFLEVNAAFEALTGKQASQIVGKTVREVWPEIDNHWIETYGRVALNGKSVRFENYSTPLGKHFEVVAFSPQPGQFATTFMDITERKRAEEALRDSQSKLEAFFSQSLDGFFFMMLDEPICWDDEADKEKLLDYAFEHHHVTKINDAMLAQYGATLEQFLGLTPRDFFQHDFEGGRDVWRRFFDAGRLHTDTDERKFDGTQMWVEGDYVCLYDSEGRITGHFGIQREVTAQKRAEDALRESEERYRSLIELSPEAIWINDDDRIVYANHSCLRLLGMDALGQIVGKSPLDIIHPDHHTAVKGRISYMLESGKAVSSLEEQLIRLDGKVIDVEITAAPIRYGNITAIQVLVHDISQRKHAEQAIRASEEQFRNIFEFSGIPIWVEDFSGAMDEISKLKEQGIADFRGYAAEHPEAVLQVAGKIKVVDVNNAVLKLFQIEDKAQLLDSLANTYSEQSLWNFREEIFAFAEGKTYYEGETASFTPTGQRRDEWVITTIPDKDRLDRVLVTVLDITERRQREREMEALATVSAALRHATRRADMLPVILDQILLLFNGQGAGIVMRDPLTGEGLIEAGRGAWTGFTDMRIPSGVSIFSRMMKTTEPFITNDLTAEISNDALEYTHDIVANEIRSTAAIPLLANEENVGVIYIGRKHPFTPLEIRMMTSIADMSANAIQRVSAHELAIRRAEQLTIVNEIGRTMAETLDLEQIYDQLYRAVFHLLSDTSVLFISMYDSEDQSITCVFGIDNGQRINPADLPSLPLRPLGEGTQSEVIHTGQPIIVGNLPERLRNTPGHVIFGGSEPVQQSGIYVPMIAHNNVIGILQVQSQIPNRYTSADAELLSVIANTAAGAVENARLFGEVHQRIDQLQALHDIDAAISSSHDLRITLDILLSNTISLLGVDAADVLQLNPYTYKLEYAAGQGFKTSPHEIERLPFEQGFAGRVASQRNIVRVMVFPAKDVSPSIANFLEKEGCKTYIGVPLTAKGLLIGILEIYHRAPLHTNAYWMDFLKTLAGQAALAIDNTELFMRLQESNTQLVMAYDATIEGWSHALDLRDKETEGHTQRVTELTIQLARVMQIPDQELIHIRRGALLHDIGKMGVPDQILLKADKLSDQEWEIMRRHPQYAYDLLSPIRYLVQSLDIPYSHHEHWDGNGYPRGLKGEHIPLAARVFAVVDVWDAIRSDRPYRAAWTEEKAMDYIKSLAGTQFDPRVVEAFVKMMQK